MPVTKFAAVATLAIALALIAVSAAAAQSPGVQVAELQCTGNPEVVTIENAGDAAQDLSGWSLQSDPPGTESFDLSAVGGLQPGASVFIQSGPFASGAFNWGSEFVFRDDDVTDYVRIVDTEGAVVDQVSCGAPAPGPTPTPEATAPVVPNGGGAPPTDPGTLYAGLMVVAGGVMATLGLATASLPFTRRPATAAAETVATEAPVARPRLRRGRRGAAFSAGVGIGVLGVVLALAFALLLDAGRDSGR